MVFQLCSCAFIVLTVSFDFKNIMSVLLTSGWVSFTLKNRTSLTCHDPAELPLPG